MLEEIIKQEVRETGSISIARYMELCLFHPTHGYYMNNDPLGVDFTTSPEISQIFGELIGIWVYMKYLEMRSPPLLNLIELGPGRGTLMKDALRVLQKFNVKTHIHLVEINVKLRAKQREALAHYNVTWYGLLKEVKVENAVLISNEFLDCLPIKQYVGEVERKVILIDTELTFSPSPHSFPSPLTPLPQGERGVVQRCEYFAEIIAAIPAKHSLFIDYGGQGNGDTLQAMKNGQYVSALTHCGQADLTAHVDFKHFEQEAQCQGYATKLSMQRDFLLALGFEARFNQLKDPTAIRLIENTSPKSMGVLFKAIELSKSP